MITIDSDKVLNIAGKRTFPVGMYAICSAYWERIRTCGFCCGTCTPSDNIGFLYHAGSPETSEIIAYKTAYENAGIYYSLSAPLVVNNMPWDLINGSYFFGYHQKDEPPTTDLTTISNTYNTLKSADPNHPVILNHWKNMTTWAPYCDILTWDMYPFTDSTNYARGDAIYAYEEISDYDFFERGNGKIGLDVNSINKPVWAVLQGNGTFLPVPISGGTGYVVPTPSEIRSNTYCAITMDVKGIVYWGYKTNSEADPTPIGLCTNLTLHAYYKQLANEINSFNDWLISPTIDYSWRYHSGNNTITFNPVLTKKVIGIQFNTNFNYILKNYNGSYYLIVVNKDSRAISNVTITINGLIDNATATTLGIATQGSGRAGRILNITNGKFTDNFDGSVVHIYKIGGSVPIINSIQISPTSANVNIGKTIQLSVICKDQSGSSMSCPTLTWISSNTSIAIVDSNGLVTGITSGSVNITASSGTISSNKTTITVVPVLSSIQINLSISTGSTIQLAAVCLDQNKNKITCPTLKWISNNTSIAIVSSSGVVTGIAKGTANITASSGAIISNTFKISIT